MPSSKNISQIQQLTEEFKSAQAAYLVEYQGLTAKDLNALRAQIKTAAAKLLVAKNTLFNRVIRDLPVDHPLSVKNFSLDLKGTTAAIIANQDQIEPLKMVVKFTKDHERPTIKAGLINHQLLVAGDVDRLAKLPGVQQLRAQVVGMLASPLARLATVLNGNLSKLVVVLDQIKQKKPN